MSEDQRPSSTDAVALERFPDLDPGRYVEVLACGEVELIGRMQWSSNATFLISLELAGDGCHAIYKPHRGERPLWDFPGGLFKREAAAWVVSEALGWHLIPETLVRPDAPLGEGSLQRFVWGDQEEHYFTLIDDPPRARLDSARRLIDLPSGAGPETPMTDDLNVGTALAMSRMYEPAALLMEPRRRLNGLADRRLADATAYGLFIQDLRLASAEFYRRARVGRVRTGDLDRAITVRTRDLWAHLRWPAAAPPFYPAGVPRELARRFSTVISVERTSAIPELYIAQVIGSLVMTPPSKPRSPHTVYVLDEATNDGFDFWLLDGAGGRVGWASGDSIFAIRTGFTDAPFRAWTELTNPRGIAEELSRIQRDSVGDLARVRVDSAGYLPGVAARLFRSGANEILGLVARDSTSAMQQQAEFVGILFHQLMETTIALHEGRHLADAHRHGSGVDAEFRAKIDEVAYATRPKLAMSAILHPNIGDQSAHGRANRRIMLGLIRWIRGNASNVDGYDTSVAPLIQLPLLTDAQLRAAFLSMRSTD